MSGADAIAQVALFAELRPDELAWVASHARTRHAAVGDEVIRQGDPGDEFLVIVEGSLEIRIDGRRVNVLGPGDFLGELALLFGAPRNATAVALVPTELLVLGSEDFALVLQRHTGVETKVLAAVAQRMRYR